MRMVETVQGPVDRIALFFPVGLELEGHHHFSVIFVSDLEPDTPELLVGAFKVPSRCLLREDDDLLEDEEVVDGLLLLPI